MKRTVALLLIAFYLFSSPGVIAKGICSSAAVHIYHTKDTCKMGVVMGKCCKAKKQRLKSKNRQYGSVAMAFFAKLFPVLSNYVSTDTEVDEPCLYRLHA